MAIRQTAHSRLHRPCAPRPPAEPPPPPSAALGSDIENGIIYPRNHDRPSSRTPPDSVRVAGGPGTHSFASQLLCWAHCARAVPRRRPTAHPAHPLRGAAAPPNFGGTRPTPSLHPRSGRRADPRPSPHGVKSRGDAWRRSLRRRSPLPSPPSSPSRAQRVPPRIWGESALPDTMVMDSLAGDTASSSGACVPAARNGRAGKKKQNPAPPALSRRCRNISGELNANKPTLLQTHFPHAILTFTPPHHHHPHQHLLLHHFTYLGAP